MDPTAPKVLRIGVDVGGTNTDGVLLDPTAPSPSTTTATTSPSILAWHKTATTADPSTGIGTAVAAVLHSASVHPSRVASVTVGTTHFVNAVVSRDASRLARVAVLRLSGPFGKHSPPCTGWPADLRALVLGYHASVPGGLEVDGRAIAEVDVQAIRRECVAIRERGIRAVVVNGVFSPVDAARPSQEERAAEIVREEIPGCEVVCAREVANLGFLERENAAVLNASILAFARRTIRSFSQPLRGLGLECPVFVSQNDGTVLSGEMAARLPIRTFSSGPTNSMRGAAFLVQGQGAGQGQLEEEMTVVDIGGTTTDVGLLLKSGFPRQQAAYSELAGVRMNFPCPDIKSIGLGGASIVRKGKGDVMTIGPDSVGYRLVKEGVAFGGSVLTATDCTIAADPALKIGDRSLVEGVLSEDEIRQFRLAVKRRIEKAIDTMKTSPAGIPVLLVGGGAIIAPDELEGASRVVRPRWAEVANAIGAATAAVSAVVDTVKSTESRTTRELIEDVSREAIEKTVAAGATRSSVNIVEVETLPLDYIQHKTRFIVRAAGDFDPTHSEVASVPLVDLSGAEQEPSMEDAAPTEAALAQPPQTHTEQPEIDLDTYRPHVQNRVWYISETDLEWITTGCYILGTGGGGSPYSHMVRLREMLRAGSVVRVVNPQDLPDDAQVGGGGGVGSPTVGIEKLAGDEMVEAQTELYKMCDWPATHMIAVEIGGANGLQSMLLGASTAMDLPVVDGDWMGRAYPTKWQTTPVVFDERTPIWSPIAMSDGNGNVVVMPKASSDAQVENIMRAALSQMGSQAGCAEPPVTGAETKRWVVEHTISQSWRIGRAVARARKQNRVDAVAEIIVDECGGPEAARVLWKGKIVGVERTLRMGHVYGECIIQGADVRDADSATADTAGDTRVAEFRGKIKIPFKNENIAAIKIQDDGSGTGAERQEDVLAIVPDLICVIDAQNGEAIGTPEYRYGLLVTVLGIAASDRWTGTERGIALGGPKAFGFDHLSYKPLGKFVKPRSVIDEFDKS